MRKKDNAIDKKEKEKKQVTHKQLHLPNFAQRGV